MGCMVIELLTGQPPFDTSLLTPTILISQIQELASDGLPERWQEEWDTNTNSSDESTGPNLQNCLKEVYFDRPHNPDLTRYDIARLGTS
ncbi:hypothetical protein N7532_010301 [Penicillium argentinense]|uniref:Protein kinase domain-containing protein n=1 Tax=Penicillium argentinense TaxID=1131581 RepID=A0A9W9JXX5_9EURO|nr:uncharacterized protein N7532_010301 [Penicillium argentinense]KAJ5085530.1 hypothetical protein N7532_010301 [Penicillium argentinense]